MKTECEIGQDWNDPIIVPGCWVMIKLLKAALTCGDLPFLFCWHFMFFFCHCWLVWYGMKHDQNIKSDSLSHKIRKLTTKGMTGAVRSAMNTFSPGTPSHCLFLPLHLCGMWCCRCTSTWEPRKGVIALLACFFYLLLNKIRHCHQSITVKHMWC